jgi:hypothetical protein
MRVTNDQRRRDWSIIIFILPLGLVMMMCVGQLAIRMSPNWSVSGEMNSSLDPETAPKQDALIVPPISSDILTPMSWWDTFLTPSGGGVVFPPFITFEPSLTPTATATPSETVSPTASPTSSVTTTPTPPTSTPTKKPTDDNNTPTPPTATATTASPTATATTPSPTATGTPATIDPTLTLVSPAPTQINTSTLPDGTIYSIDDGDYVVLNLAVQVSATSDGNYDLAFYESPFGVGIQIDYIIVGISNLPDGSQYYEVFNWYNGIPDTNSNVGDVATTTGTENDNQNIAASELYDPDGGGSAPQTGILIDVDNAPSNPPPTTYNYVVVISPNGGTGEDGQVDAVNTVEEPIPTP